jgi:hypothetical protein
METTIVCLEFILSKRDSLCVGRFYCWVYSGGNNMRQAILQALEDKYTAQISEADATIKIYLDNSVGIGEHPQHIEEIDKLMQKIVDAQEKLKELQAFKL